VAIYVDFVCVKGEDLLQPSSLERTWSARTADSLLILPRKVANGTSSRSKYTDTLPQVLCPYITISSASLDLRDRAAELCLVA